MTPTTPTTQGVLSASLVTSHFWAAAVAYVSVTAQLIATVTGAIIGVITLYRMWRNRSVVAMPAPEHHYKDTE